MKPAYNNDTTPAQRFITQEQLKSVEAVLEQELVSAGVRTVLLTDMAGNIIAEYDNGNFSSYSISALATLAAANSAAMDFLAETLGEKEFSLILKGKDKTAHFRKLDNRFLLLTVSGRDVSLGLLRMKFKAVSVRIRAILKDLFGLSFPPAAFQRAESA